jgi:hypothetical protein
MSFSPTHYGSVRQAADYVSRDPLYRCSRRRLQEEMRRRLQEEMVKQRFSVSLSLTKEAPLANSAASASEPHAERAI